MKKIVIIGGGLSGLAASCYLAKNNYDVTLVDKNESVGGRLTSIEQDGFIFDLGPTWYWMPDVFDKFFNDFNKKTSDYYKLVRLEPSYKFFANKSHYDISSNENDLNNMFESIEPGSSIKMQKFMEEAAIKYKLSMDHFISVSYTHLTLPTSDLV